MTTSATVVKKQPGNNFIRILLISLSIIVLTLIATAGQLVYSILSYDKIYKGVYIGKDDVGNKSRENVISLLEPVYNKYVENSYIDLFYKEHKTKFSFKDIDVQYDVKAAVDKAMLVGRDGNMIIRLLQIMGAGRSNIVIAVKFTYNKNKLKTIINDLYDKVMIPVKETDVIVDQSQITLIAGRNGESFDREKAFKSAEDMIMHEKSGVLTLELIDTSPGKIDINALYDKIYIAPEDAAFKVENNNVTFIPQVIGKSFDRELASSTLASLKKQQGSSGTIPIISTNPKVFVDEIKARVFKDVLFTHTTSFNSSYTTRAANIKIACSKINNTVLAPGEVFSYNKVVGPRTRELGYQDAHTYVGGKVVDGTGGGVCQVSTTLFYNVIFADLEVVQRTNHQMTVAYVPLGHDAAVAYGTVDFKFRNSTNWPLKIVSSVKNNKIIFALIGTNENPGKKVETRIETIKTYDFDEKIIKDSSMYEGEKKVTQQGMKGYLIYVYKIIKQDGKVVSEALFSKNYYKPLNQEVHVGAKKREAAKPAQPAKDKPAQIQTPSSPPEEKPQDSPPPSN